MRSIMKYALLLVLALGAGVIWGCSNQAHDDHSSDVESQAGTGYEVGQVAPSFSLERVGGDQLDLADLRGDVVLLDFWDTWCPPCRKALPHLQEISTEYTDGFTVVGVALGQEGAAKVDAFVSSRGFTFPFVRGNVAVFQKFGVQSLPTTLLIDKDGVIRKRWVGGYPKAEYEKAVMELIAG